MKRCVYMKVWEFRAVIALCGEGWPQLILSCYVGSELVQLDPTVKWGPRRVVFRRSWVRWDPDLFSVLISCRLGFCVLTCGLMYYTTVKLKLVYLNLFFHPIYISVWWRYNFFSAHFFFWQSYIKLMVILK